MGAKLKIKDKKYGRLFVIEKTNLKTKNGCYKWRCICDCGNEVLVRGNSLVSGITKSCGCLQKEITSEQGKKNSGSNNGMYGVCREQHHNWKGETHRTEEDRLRKSCEYKRWRNLVFERDNYTCQKCKNYGCLLNSHHINNFAEYPELRFEIDNGISLCETCHREFHSIYKRVNNNIIQIEEFILLEKSINYLKIHNKYD